MRTTPLPTGRINKLLVSLHPWMCMTSTSLVIITMRLLQQHVNLFGN